MRMLILLLTLVLITSSLRAETPNYVDPLVIKSACARYEAFDCDLVRSIIYVESRGDLNKTNIVDTNNKYSKGLMLVQELAARDAGLKGSFEQLSQSTLIGLRFGISYLELKLKENNYNIERAAAAYNAGRVIICKKLNRNVCYPGEFFNQGYVWKVMRHYRYLLDQTERPLIADYQE